MYNIRERVFYIEFDYNTPGSLQINVNVDANLRICITCDTNYIETDTSILVLSYYGPNTKIVLNKNNYSLAYFIVDSLLYYSSF